MALGPLETIVVTFPRQHLVDGVRATLDRLAGVGSMNIADVVIIRTGVAVRPQAVELSDLPALHGLAGLATGLLPQTDIDELAAMLPADTDALAVLLEHQWVRDLADPVSACRGTIVAVHHIPAVAVVHRPELVNVV